MSSDAERRRDETQALASIFERVDVSESTASVTLGDGPTCRVSLSMPDDYPSTAPLEVTLKTDGEIGGTVDHTMFACVSLAVMGSIALVTVGKSWLRSPVAAPEVNIELLSKSLDLEDQNPIVAPAESRSSY